MPSPRKGGWRSRTGMHWSEKRLIHELAYRGWINLALDVHPPEGFEGSEQERKRWCHGVIRKFGQALKRRGQKWVAVTVWEQDEGSHLHAHHLCRVEPRNFDVVDRFEDGATLVSLRLNKNNFGDAIGYRTKQRLPLGDEIEAELCKSRNNRRKKGSPIRGRRVTFHEDAQKVIAGDTELLEIWFKAYGDRKIAGSE